MQNIQKGFLFFWVICLAPAIVLADFSAVHKYTAAVPSVPGVAVSVEVVHTNSGTTDCVVAFRKSATPDNAAERTLTVRRVYAPSEGKYTLTLNLTEKDGAFLYELQVVEETLAGAVTRTAGVRDYRWNTRMVHPKFTEVGPAKTEALELMGGVILQWAIGRNGLKTGDSLQADVIGSLGLLHHIKAFAETPIRAYLAE